MSSIGHHRLKPHVPRSAGSVKERFGAQAMSVTKRVKPSAPKRSTQLKLT